MAPGGTLFRFTLHFGENVLPHGSHEWLPYSKDQVHLKSVNNNFLSLPIPGSVLLGCTSVFSIEYPPGFYVYLEHSPNLPFF